MKLSNNILLTMCLLASLPVFGQIKNTAGDNTVDVTFQYKPKINDAVKIDVNPVSETVTAQKPYMEYATKPSALDVKTQKARLPAPAMKGTGGLDELHHNFVKLAFGNYSNLYAEYFYNSLRNREQFVTAHLLHHSGNGPVKGSAFGNNLIDLYGRKLLGKTALDGNIGFHQDIYHWYGQTDSINKKPYPRQAFTLFNLGANLENAGAENDAFHYKTGIGFYTFKDKFNTSENDFQVKATAIQPLNDNRIVVNAAFDYMGYKFINSQSRTFTIIDASYIFRTNGIRINAGFKTANEHDSTGGKFHAYPDIQAEADIVAGYLTVYGTLTGGLEKNTYRALANENPFIAPGSKLRNANKKFEISGGIRGNLNSKSVYKASIAYKNYENLYFFMNDSSNKKVFVPAYDTGTTTVLNFNAEFGYSVSESFNLNTSLDINNYAVSSLAKPFERPALKWMLTGRYNIQKKIIFTGDAFILGRRWAGIYGQTDEKNLVSLPAIMDFNLGVTYVLTNLKGLQAFVEAQNVLGSRYSIWNYYPQRGFQLIGGIKLSFL